MLTGRKQDLPYFHDELDGVFGVRIHIIANDDLCVEKKYKQFRFPKSKKKRIRAKFKKNSKNFRWFTYYRTVVFNDNSNIMYVPSVHFEQINKQYQEMMQKQVDSMMNIVMPNIDKAKGHVFMTGVNGDIDSDFNFKKLWNVAHDIKVPDYNLFKTTKDIYDR